MFNLTLLRPSGRAQLSWALAVQNAAQRQDVSNEKSPFVRTGLKSLERTTGLLDALRAPRPLRLKPSGEFLKTAHWAVFLTEFHLIGSSPATCLKNKNSRGDNLGCESSGADNGARTRDPHLGKVVLYQLSHVRTIKWWAIQDLNL